MAVEIVCPECGETLTLAKAVAPSKRLQCPDCEHIFRVGGTKKKIKPATTASGMPAWAPYAIGGGALVLVAVVLIFALGGKGKTQDVAQNPPPPAQLPVEAPPAQPIQPAIPQPQPQQERDPLPPTPVVVPPVNPLVPPAPTKPTVTPRPLPPRIEIPPLPPAEQRPGLVLDPGNHTSQIRQVAFTPDGKRFITVGGDKTIRVWDTETGTTTRTIVLAKGADREGVLFAVAVSPDGKSIAVGGDPLRAAKQLVFALQISLESGEVLRTFGGHPGSIHSLDFSSDGKQLATGCADGAIRIFKVSTGDLVSQFKGHENRISCVRFQPKGPKLASVALDGTTRLWAPVPNTKEYASIPLITDNPSKRLESVVWSKDGKSIITGGIEGIVRTWSSVGKPIRAYPRYETSIAGQPVAPVQISGMALTHDGKDVVLGGVAYLGNSALLNLQSGEIRIDRLGKHSNTVTAVAASPKDDYALTTGGDANEIQIWRTTDGSIVHDIRSGSKGLWAVRSGAPGVIAFGDINRGQALPLTRAVTTAFDISKLEFIPVPEKNTIPAQEKLGPYSATLADFYTVDVLKGGQGYLRYRLPEASNERIYSASLYRNGDQAQLLVGTAFNMRLIDLNTKQIVRSFKGHNGIVTTLAPTEDGFFVTGCSDQTIRIYHPEREDPILSLFFADREWIAWTPEGYYAASAGGERLMGWQVNNATTKAASYYSAVQFRQTLFQPAIIRNLFVAKGDLGLAMAIAIRDTKKPIPAVSVSQVLPPQVAITSPKVIEDGEVLSEKEALEVTASAQGTDKHPVRALRLLVDGRPYRGDQGLKVFADPKAGETRASWMVSLSPGKHTLIVQADNGVSKGLSSSVDVTQKGDDKTLPSLYVCAIGVNEYAGKLKLNFAATDARAITEVMKVKTAGVFEKVQVKLITDRDATKKGILEGLNWLNSMMTPRDVGIFFFSGHGMSGEDGNFYLVPVDVNPLNPQGTCLPGDVVRQKLTDMPGRLIAMLDACHSGGAAEALQTTSADGLVRELLTDECGVVVLCSSLSDEVSLESSQTRAGFFTFSLIEGLNGLADFNGDGFIHIHEATAYAVMRVRQLSKGTQNPTLGRSPHLRPFALTKK